MQETREKNKDRVPNRYNRRVVANKVVKQVLVVQEKSSSESDELENQEDVFMMVVEDDVQIYDSYFALTAKSNDDEDEKVTILDIKENLKDYSPKEFRSLTVVDRFYM